MDQQVGDILKQLKEDGLAENTIVFFFLTMDQECLVINGLLTAGCMYPCLSVIEGQHLALAKPGQTTNRMVSFVDFGPTVLNLTGTTYSKVHAGQTIPRT